MSLLFSAATVRKAVLCITVYFLGAVASAKTVSATLCADASQVAKIQAAFNKENPPALHQAAATLAMPEAVILSGLGAERAHGVSGKYFTQIWKMLESWQTAVVVVMKGGHVFETHGPIQAGEPSKRSQFFNLHGHQDGMSGHLRPDLISAIFAVSLPAADDTLRGILFYDAQGDVAFGVYVPGEGATPPPALIAQFETTRREIRALPATCP